MVGIRAGLVTSGVTAIKPALHKLGVVQQDFIVLKISSAARIGAVQPGAVAVRRSKVVSKMTEDEKRLLKKKA